MTHTTLVVQKGKEQWEIARDANTKTTGDLKVGDKITVHYTMTAVSVEDKGAAKPAADKPKPMAKKPGDEAKTPPEKSAKPTESATTAPAKP